MASKKLKVRYMGFTVLAGPLPPPGFPAVEGTADSYSCRFDPVKDDATGWGNADAAPGGTIMLSLTEPPKFDPSKTYEISITETA